MLTGIAERAAEDSGLISSNLALVFTNLRDTDPDIRLVDMYYPYVVDQTSACFLDNPTTGAVGAKSIIDALDDAHAAADGSVAGICVLDLRSAFGPDPNASGYINRAGKFLPSTQGYPHPTETGQDLIAAQAAAAIEAGNS